MKRLRAILILAGISMSCNSSIEEFIEIDSPDSTMKIAFNVNAEGQPYYMVKFQNAIVIDTSYLGFEFTNATPLINNFKIVNASTQTFNDTWQMPWGEQLNVVNHYNELQVELEETTELNRKLNLVFKVYDDGIGFRYEFPEQDGWNQALIKEEHTEFNFTEDYTTYWNPGDWDIYEHLYNTTKLSEINALNYVNQPIAQTYIPINAVNTPVTMVGDTGVHLSIHEAALVDYSGMTLKVLPNNLSLVSHLVGSENTDYKVKRNLPFHTPWRTIQISDNAPDLIESNLIVNLNEPNSLEDISWFKPMKYAGIWWEMHLGKSSWDMSSGSHGATTKNAKQLIDFSSENNISGVLVEGWNTGWSATENRFDFVTPYPDYNIEDVVNYGKSKGVDIIMHHETYGDVEQYNQHQDTAFALMQSLDIHTVKTGYVGRLKPKGEYHHGQFMVNHFNNTAQKAAQYQVAVNTHEPIKPTGLRRTFPNIISCEGLRGQEFSIWGQEGGNPPEHLSIVAFTRMLAGPIDYTPGIFNIKFDEYKKNNQVNTTLAQQLALYVVIYSPIQMAADIVEHYKANPKPLQFIKDVGVDWEVTKVLHGQIGDYVTIARKERDTGNWFLGSITDENSRELEVKFEFLDPNQNYTATIYKDAKNAHWDHNPLAINIETISINHSSKLKLILAEGGGCAISIIKKE